MERDALNADPATHRLAVCEIAASIRAIAKQRRLSISEAAKAFGLSRATIYSWERKIWKRPLRFETRRALIDAVISTSQLREQVIAYDQTYCDAHKGLSRPSKVRPLSPISKGSLTSMPFQGPSRQENKQPKLFSEA